MKILLLTTFLFLVEFTFSQSKKEQIERLSFQIDSLTEIVNQLNANLIQLKNEKNQFTEEIVKLKKDNLSINKDLLDRESSLETMKSTHLKKVQETNLLKDSFQIIYDNNKIIPLLKSATYAGSYSFEYEKGPTGSLHLYFDGNEDYYFYLDFVKGPPSFNMGTLEGIMKIYGNTGVFTSSIYGGDLCKIFFVFDENGVFIKQYSDDSACGFGGNVIIQEYYIKIDSENTRIQPSENASGSFIKSTNKW